jgi:hypothetical protein
MEPLRINQLGMENNAGNIRIKALFSDILAYGASNWTVKEVRTDVKVMSWLINFQGMILIRHLNWIVS